jgi:hypothetical protein
MSEPPPVRKRVRKAAAGPVCPRCGKADQVEPVKPFVWEPDGDGGSKKRELPDPQPFCRRSGCCGFLAALEPVNEPTS